VDQLLHIRPAPQRACGRPPCQRIQSRRPFATGLTVVETAAVEDAVGEAPAPHVERIKHTLG